MVRRCPIKGVAITRVGAEEVADQRPWVLLHLGPDEWSLRRCHVLPATMLVDRALCAVLPGACDVDLALEMSKLVQEAVERHGDRTRLRYHDSDLAGRFASEIEARRFAKLVRERMNTCHP